MQQEDTLLRGLIAVLDDARNFYGSVEDRAAHPYFQRVLQRAIQIHFDMATELVDCVAECDGTTMRSGTFFGPLQSWHATWRARASIDIEDGYAIQSKKYAARVLQHFRDAAERTQDTALRDQISGYRQKLEHAYRDFCRAEFILQSQAADPLRVFAEDERIAVRVRVPPVPMTATVPASRNGLPR